jgi:hypothetical protein
MGSEDQWGADGVADQSGRVDIEPDRPYLRELSDWAENVLSDADEHHGELLYERPGTQDSSGILSSGS